MSKVRNAKDQEQELSVREMILGVLKAKDQSGCNIIHSSDFRTAITDLGFPMGSSIIENILVHCKLDTRGNLDFSDLERELVRERRVHNSQKKPEAPPVSTSSGFVSKPWRGDEIHRAKVEAEKQLLTVTEHGPAVKEVYESLSHHHITAREALEQLQSLDIHPTKDFVKLLQSMTFNEVSYADFVRSLTRFSTHQDLEGAHVCAGTAKPKSGDVDIIGLQRKRSTTGMKTAFHESADVEVKTKTFRKMASAGSVNDQVIFKAKQIKETLFCDNEAVPLLSHNQADMVIGARGNKDLSIGFNIETRLQREQVLAALRKLDSGEITMDDFQDMLFSVGIDLPETLAVDIRRSAAAGRMDVRKYVKMMDANIFKANAIEDQISAEDAQKMKNKFRSAVLRQGLDALMDLSIIFRDVDTDNDGTLTFSEFKAGCAMLRLNHSLTDNDLRMLFNAFDKNGDGVLQHDEFISAIRGDVSPTRALWIRRAFQKIDRQGKGQVSIDTVGELFRAEGHPSIKVGQKTAREATTDLLRWFTTDQEFDGMVTYPAFEQYFANLSANIKTDGEFVDILKQCWSLSDQAPAPPVYTRRHSNETPMAIQSHGDYITWNQEHSMLEQKELEDEARKGRKLKSEANDRNAKSDVIRWENHAYAPSSPENSFRDELKEQGVTLIATGRRNFSNKSLLSWAESKPTSTPAPTQAPPTVFKLPYQDDFAAAGSPALKPNQYQSGNVTGHAKGAQRQQGPYKMSVPFGIDQVPDANSANNSTGVKSLADIVKAKSTSKSLASYMK